MGKKHGRKTMKECIKRRSSDYHAKRMNEIEELDKIASTILATSYSRRTKQTPTSQALIQFDCVATCFVNGELWVASNSGKITSADLVPVWEAYPDMGIYIVTNGNGKMHAEMQLVMEIKEVGFAFPDYIGVSKPCRIYCAKVLNDTGIKYAHYHTDTVIHWEKPF